MDIKGDAGEREGARKVTRNPPLKKPVKKKKERNGLGTKKKVHGTPWAKGGGLKETKGKPAPPKMKKGRLQERKRR